MFGINEADVHTRKYRIFQLIPSKGFPFPRTDHNDVMRFRQVHFAGSQWLGNKQGAFF